MGLVIHKETSRRIWEWAMSTFEPDTPDSTKKLLEYVKEKCHKVIHWAIKHGVTDQEKIFREVIYLMERGGGAGGFGRQRLGEMNFIATQMEYHGKYPE